MIKSNEFLLYCSYRLLEIHLQFPLCTGRCLWSLGLILSYVIPCLRLRYGGSFIRSSLGLPTIFLPIFALILSGCSSWLENLMWSTWWFTRGFSVAVFEWLGWVDLYLMKNVLAALYYLGYHNSSFHFLLLFLKITKI